MTRVIYYSNQRVLPLLHLDPLPSLALITTHNRQNEADGNNKNDKDDWLLLYGKSSAMAWYDFLLVSELSGQSKVINNTSAYHTNAIIVIAVRSINLSSLYTHSRWSSYIIIPLYEFWVTYNVYRGHIISL